MRMRKVVFVALCLFVLPTCALGTSPASAADLDWRTDRSFKDEPIVVPRYNFSWAGYYLGGNLGYTWGHSTTGPQAGDPFNGGGDGFVVHPSGLDGGIQGGYNWQTGNLLAGIEVDLGILDASDQQNSATAFVRAEYGNYGTLAGRLGMVDDRWLFYVKGGLALADIENRAGALTGGVINPTFLTDSDKIRAGYAIGGGAEFAFQPNWSMKIEYMYMDFGKDTSGNADGDSFRHDNALSSVKVGVNYRFQLPEPLR
jgi:outer membrane immunogenic protein